MKYLFGLKSTQVLSITEMTSKTLSNNSSDSRSVLSELNSDQLVYNELADIPLKGIGELERLSENINVLNNLNSRLSFVMKELSYLLKVT